MQNSLDSLLVPVVKVAELQAIPYAETTDGPIQYLTPAEFKQNFNCDYMEGLYIAHNQLARYLTTLEENVERTRINCDANALVALLSPKALQSAVRERLNHPLMSVVIRKFPTGTGIDYGLFATAIIPKGTVIIYSGEFLERNEQNKYRLLTHGAIAERGKVDCHTFNCTTTYSIRDQLCNSEILPSVYYGRLSYTIAAVTFLRNCLPNVDVQAYYANPRELEMATHGNPSSLDTYKVNIVCRASTESQFCSMISFFGAANRRHCQAKMMVSASIGQIVLTDVNECDQHSGRSLITEELSNTHIL